MSKHIKQACERLTKQYALSKTEKHIAYLIAMGHKPQEIAEIRERSLETVRTQIKHLMHKVGVSRVNNLVIEVYRYNENL
jgi:DNA-binding CsgD family transcriptional regulator